MAEMLMGKKPTPKPVVAMPDEGDPGIRAAGAKRVAQMVGGGGRDSTLLSMDQERGSGGNGGAYSSPKLGSVQ
jgi:hypothetical protein